MFEINTPLSPLLEQKLLDAGLTKQQVRSPTAKACAAVFMPDDCKTLYEEAWLQVNAAQTLVSNMKEEQFNVAKQIEKLGQTIAEIASAQDEYNIDSIDERARNALCMYSAILNMNKKVGVSGDESVDAASYCVYAYLGGQAKREITLNDNSAKKNELFKNIPKI